MKIQHYEICHCKKFRPFQMERNKDNSISLRSILRFLLPSVLGSPQKSRLVRGPLVEWSMEHLLGGPRTPTRCVGQSFRSVMVTVLSIPSRTVVVGPVRFRTVQSGHQEGGIGRAVEFVGIGVSVSTGSTEV